MIGRIFGLKLPTKLNLHLFRDVAVTQLLIIIYSFTEVGILSLLSRFRVGFLNMYILYFTFTAKCILTVLNLPIVKLNVFVIKAICLKTPLIKKIIVFSSNRLTQRVEILPNKSQ